MAKRSTAPSGGGSFVRLKDGSLRRLTAAEKEAAAKEAGYVGFAEAASDVLADQRFSASAVFDRIKEALGCDSDAELAYFMDTSSQNIWNRRSRNSVPYLEATFISIFAKVSLDYLLTGRGQLREGDQ